MKCRSRSVVRLLLLLAYSSLPTRISVVSSSRTTVAADLALAEPLPAQLVLDGRLDARSAWPNASIRPNFASSRSATASAGDSDTALPLASRPVASRCPSRNGDIHTSARQAGWRGP